MNNKQLGGKIRQLKKKLEMAEFLLSGKSLKDFLEKYPRKYHGNMIYDVPLEDNEDGSKKVVNDIMYHKAKYDMKQYDQLIEQEDGFINHMLKLLKKDSYDILENYYDAITLSDYLNKWVGIKLFKEEQKLLKEFIKKHTLKPINGSHNSLGIHTLNGHFKDHELDYLIESKRESQGVNKGKWYWIIGKITY